MLTELKISNYAIAQELEIDFRTGLTTVTGETGAGKSIMIDALTLALGARADSSVVSAQAERAEIIATFDISNNSEATKWLSNKSLDADGECLLRRSISKDGKSRAFINGIASPLQDLKQLAEKLINIHSQHQHQALLKKESHRGLLDEFCNNANLLAQVSEQFKVWQHCEKKFKELSDSQSNRVARIDFLNFQSEELNELNMEEGEFEKLNQEQKRLANIDHYLTSANSAILALTDQEENTAAHLISIAQQAVSSIASDDPKLSAISENISSALIQIEEASADISHYLDQLESDPQRLIEIDQRIASIHQLARKHRIKPEQVPQFHQDILSELDSLQNSDQTLEALEKELKGHKGVYLKLAEKLSKKRSQTAKKLDKSITARFAELGMENAIVETRVRALQACDAKAYGIDDIEMLIATNPGQSPQPLSKVASGGELSRISLAIQVNYAEKTSVPALIFDEVDVGIGGSTAEVVGRLLKMLSQHSQVICVTHLPQVAAQGHQHLKVIKDKNKNLISTQVSSLDGKEKVVEIARMLGGLEMTNKTLSHAKEMLKLAAS